MIWIKPHWVAIAVGTALFIGGAIIGASGERLHKNRPHRANQPGIVTVTRVTTVRVSSSGTFLADR